SLRIMGKIPATDAFVLVLVSAVTVFTDLAVAVVVGVIISALAFAWEHAKHINIKSYDDERGSRVHALNGPLFFGSVKNFLELFDPEKDPNHVIIDFQNSRVADHSAIEAIDTLAEKYINAGKILQLRYLSTECRQLLKKADDLVEVNVLEDLRYHVANNRLV
ncbi:MAG: sodium-independent anion transporter, partial [Gammaproteobacteria bacterium]